MGGGGEGVVRPALPSRGADLWDASGVIEDVIGTGLEEKAGCVRWPTALRGNKIAAVPNPQYSNLGEFVVFRQKKVQKKKSGALGNHQSTLLLGLQYPEHL